MLLRRFIMGIIIVFSGNQVLAADSIRAAGSSTVYPFITIVAEEFGHKTKFRTPIIESIGTGGGFKLFCSGVGKNTPDISNASRPIKDGEVELCKKAGINEIIEVKIGYDGIVVANSTKAKRLPLTKEILFSALAKKIPADGKIIDNPYKKWSDIDKSLPSKNIEVYGPPPTSGTRDAFIELVMEDVCMDLPEFKASYSDKKSRKKACHLLREDGAFIDAGENDNLIMQKLTNNYNALGIFGFSYLEQNAALVQGNAIAGVLPSFETIADGTYSISRPLFVYFKGESFNKTAGLKEFAQELTNESTIGNEGYLSESGLIPLQEDEILNLQSQLAKYY